MNYLPDEEFYSIYSKVPRLTIDLLIESDEGVLLSCRGIQPYLGLWHLPGGTVYKDESLMDAAVRIAKKETGLIIKPEQSISAMEFQNENRNGTNMHTISIVVRANRVGGELTKNEDSSDIQWFKSLPEGLITQHRDFLQRYLGSIH